MYTYIYIPLRIMLLFARSQVDGELVSAQNVLSALVGSDQVGSIVELKIKDMNDSVSIVCLRRADARQIAAKRRLFKSNPALKDLIDAVKKEAKDTGFLVGLDGRPLTVRKPHAALNTRLQSTGAILCKRWVVRTKIEMDRLKFQYRDDWRYLTWPHDETQSAARTREVAEALADAAKRMTQEAGEFYGFRCPLAGDAMIGRSWAECH